MNALFSNAPLRCTSGIVYYNWINPVTTEGERVLLYAKITGVFQSLFKVLRESSVKDSKLTTFIRLCHLTIFGHVVGYKEKRYTSLKKGRVARISYIFIKKNRSSNLESLTCKEDSRVLTKSSLWVAILN